MAWMAHNRCYVLKHKLTSLQSKYGIEGGGFCWALVVDECTIGTTLVKRDVCTGRLYIFYLSAARRPKPKDGGVGPGHTAVSTQGHAPLRLRR